MRLFEHAPIDVHIFQDQGQAHPLGVDLKAVQLLDGVHAKARLLVL